MGNKDLKTAFAVGEKVTHTEYGDGSIRILKPFEKSYVEFDNAPAGEESGDSNCKWVKNTELVKSN
jgi:hypothetical protein